MVRVNSCFGCINLYTGGRILAWFGMVCSGITLVGCTAALLAVIFGEDSICFRDEKNENRKSCIKRGVIIAILVLFIAFMAISFYIDYILRKGINYLNHKKVLPAVIVYAISVILEIISLGFSGGVANFIGILIIAVLTFYLTVVLYSIYVSIKEDKVPSRNYS